MKIENNILYLESYELDHMFCGIQDTKKSYDNLEKIKSIYIFNLEQIKGIKFNEEQEIQIPKNVKFPSLKTFFNGFKDLYLFMYENRDNSMVNPYFGIDIKERK